MVWLSVLTPHRCCGMTRAVEYGSRTSVFHIVGRSARWNTSNMFRFPRFLFTAAYYKQRCASLCGFHVVSFTRILTCICGLPRSRSPSLHAFTVACGALSFCAFVAFTPVHHPPVFLAYFSYGCTDPLTVSPPSLDRFIILRSPPPLYHLHSTLTRQARTRLLLSFCFAAFRAISGIYLHLHAPTFYAGSSPAFAIHLVYRLSLAIDGSHCAVALVARPFTPRVYSRSALPLQLTSLRFVRYDTLRGYAFARSAATYVCTPLHCAVHLFTDSRGYVCLRTRFAVTRSLGCTWVCNGSLPADWRQQASGLNELHLRTTGRAARARTVYQLVAFYTGCWFTSLPKTRVCAYAVLRGTTRLRYRLDCVPRTRACLVRC